ncbi:MAG: hypothetical protein PVI30_16840 [Myxococcales bacterium]
MMNRIVSMCTVLLATVGLAASASAQANPELGDVNAQGGGSASFGTGGGAQAQAQGDLGGSAPAVSGPVASDTDLAEEELPPGESDHASVVGDLGVGFFGVIAVPYLSCQAPGPAGPCGAAEAGATFGAPSIGARYWLDETLGIEAALGVAVSNNTLEGSTAMATTEQPLEPSIFAMALHGGVPLALASDGHFSFQVVPELNVAFLSGSYEFTGGPTIDVSGFLLELGATAGAEIQFGFIGIPQLSLQGNVGLSLRLENRGAENGNANVSSDQSAFRFGTGLGDDPWDIFAGSVSAIYYFDMD